MIINNIPAKPIITAKNSFKSTLSLSKKGDNNIIKRGYTNARAKASASGITEIAKKK